MKYKLIAIDVDGTLVNSKAQISQRTKRAIRKAVEKGAMIVIVTGRRFCSAKPIVEGLGVDLMIAAHNGVLLKRINGEFITGRFLKPEAARDAVKIVKRFGIEPIVYRGTGDYAEIFVEEPRAEWLVGYIEHNSEHTRIVPSLEKSIEWEVLEVMSVMDRSMVDEVTGCLREGLEGRAKVLKQVPQEGRFAFVEVADSRVAKDYPLRFLCRRFGISREEVIAFGDNFNDLEMLEFAGLGVVMENAHDELKRKGFMIAPSNEDDGVAQVLERLMDE
ncbi:TPA: HAD family phosphatase [Candidatus Poribacteria bacterium]|nr:HAD family phosphatase [Candidatus Poribacteria bacterium]